MASSAASRGSVSAGRLRSPLTLPFQDPTGTPAAFSWRFARFHAYTYTAVSYLDKPMNPLYNFAKRRWDARQEPLWFSIIAKKHVGVNNRRCVRSWLARRLRAAFVHSLKKNGYAPDGTRLEGSQGDNLLGTAQIIAEQPMIKMDKEMVQEQTDKAVLEIIKIQSGLPVRTVKRKKVCGTKGSAGRAGSLG